MALKAKIEAVIYAAEEPVTLEQISLLVKPAVLQELAEEHARAAEEAATEAENATTESQESALQPAQTAELPEPMVEAESDQTDEEVTSSHETASAAEQLEAADEQPASEVDFSVPSQDAEVSGAAMDSNAGESLTAAKAEQSSSEQQSTPLADATESAPAAVAPKRKPKNEIPPEVKARVREVLEELISDYASADRGMEIRRIAGGFRMATKPEHHDVVKAFAKSLKPPLRLSLPALETLAVVAYKQPVTAPEVSEIRGVDSQGVVATLLDRKLITTAGRKAVIGRPILYKTTKEFLMRFGLKDVSELPSMEEFEKLALDAGQVDMFEPEEQEVPAGSSTLHDVESASEPGEPVTDGAASGEADVETDTAQPAVPVQVEDVESDTTSDHPSSEQSMKS
jgi:segregation and condensation protein B